MSEPQTFPEVDQEWQELHARAERWRDTADKLTKVHGALAWPVATAIALSGIESSWQNAFTDAAMIGEAAEAALDKADGTFGKHGTTIDGEPTRPKSGEDDERTDKRVQAATSLGFIVRELLQGNNKRAAFIAANAATVMVRDTVYKSERVAASGNKSHLSRAKTALQKTTSVVMASRLDRNPAIQTINNIAVLGGTALSLISYGQFKLNQRRPRISVVDSSEELDVVDLPSGVDSATPAERPNLVLLTSN